MLLEDEHHPTGWAHRGWTAVALVALALAGCGRDVTLTIRTGDRPPNPDPPISSAPTSVQRVAVAGVAVDHFQIVLRNFRLQATPTTDGAPSGDDQPIGPATILVDLAGAQLDAGVMTELVSAELVRWASFYQSVITLGPVAEGDVAANAALAPLLGKTLVISGRLPGGAPFTYESSVAVVLVRPATYRMGLNHNNVTINVELNKWFQGPDGVPLDPNDPAAKATIESNILQSIDAYMDDNRDGKPDSLG